MERDHQFWLRLIVTRIEGLLAPRPEDLLTLGPADSFSHRMYPAWKEATDLDDARLRTALSEAAAGIEEPPEPGLVQYLRTVHDHTPVRVGLLTPGPEEWGRGLLERLDLESQVDYLFTFDNYQHADRDVQLQFLMNRFVAGRQRTLFIGADPSDQRVARRQDARFCSPLPAPEDPPDASRWGWDLVDLKEYLEAIQPEE